jgi:hypothetical protein
MWGSTKKPISVPKMCQSVMGLTIAEKTNVAEKNTFHMNVWVAERERPVLRNDKDNTRSLAYCQGSKTPLKLGGNRNDEENKTACGRKNLPRLEQRG